MQEVYWFDRIPIYCTWKTLADSRVSCVRLSLQQWCIGTDKGVLCEAIPVRWLGQQRLISGEGVLLRGVLAYNA